MQRMIKKFLWIVLLAVGGQGAWGFALLGPQTLANGADSWQSAALGYNLAYMDDSIPGDPVFLGDIGGPRNIGEGYRRNVPVLYYTYDETFLNFFGTDGAATVDAAFSVMNGVPKANSINLSLYPDETQQFNYYAQTYFLTDLKSMTLHLLVEQLGLADPERFSWTLHDRILPSGGVCPVDEWYTVVGRNYDDYLNFSVTNLIYSSYVNDVLYSYFVIENCTGTPTAYTVPFSTDPEATAYTAVAANNFDGSGIFYLNTDQGQPLNTGGGLQVGTFYSGLTRDDVAGLKYLYATNMVAYEMPDPTALLFSVVTNTSPDAKTVFPNITGTNVIAANGLGFYFFDGTYGYGDYGWLVATSVTNSPAVLQALYPGLIIASSSNYFGYVTNYTYTQYYGYQSGIGQPWPPPLVLITVTNKVVTWQEKYSTKFANVFLDKVSPTTTIKQETISIVPNYGAPYGSGPKTNVTVKTITLNSPSGDFFVLPLFHTNVCPLDLVQPFLTNVLAITNVLAGSTTNVVTTTNTFSYSSSLIQVNYLTNYVWLTYPVTCGEIANAASLYQGNGGVKFQRADFDSLLSQFFVPITNYYTMVMLTNSQWRTVHFVRVVTRPDFLLDASDQGLANTFVGSVLRNINFTPSPYLNGLAGPGTIDSPTTITYDKIGLNLWNSYDFQVLGATLTNQYLGKYGAIPGLAWASFGFSTNMPEVYGNGTSLANLENQLTVQLSPSTVPNGSVGSAYSVQFTATGGAFSGPFTWSTTSYAVGDGVQEGLPPGLVLSSTGLLSGTPVSSGIYDFVLQLTDSLGRSVQWNFSITIN